MQQTKQALIDEARLLYDDGRPEEAEARCREALDGDPRDDEALRLLGLCRRAQGDLDGAVGCIEQALEVVDSDPEAHFLLGEMKMESGRWEEARESLDRALELDPNHAPARTASGFLVHQTGDLPRAAQILRTALRADSDFYPAQVALARVLVELGDLDEALRNAARAAEMTQDEPFVQSTLGWVFLAQGHTDFAERCYRNALELDPDNAEFEVGLAAVLHAAGRLDEAEQWFRRSLARGSRDLRIVLGLAHTLNRVGKHDDAREVLEQAGREHPDNHEISVRLAENRLLAQDLDAAGELLERLASDDLRVPMLQARIAEAAGRLEEAQQLLGPILESGHALLAYQARLLLGRIALAQCDPYGARAALDPLIGADPPDPTAVLLWKDICVASGDQDGACAALEDLLARGRLDERQAAHVHELAARLLDRSGDHAAAANHLDQAGWRETGLVRRLSDPAIRRAGEAWSEIRSPDWTPYRFDGDYPDPMVVLGWPGSGRSLLIAALGNHPRVSCLDPTREAERRRIIGLPLLPDAAAAMEETDLRLARKRFLRAGGVRGNVSGLLDIAFWEMSALPALARYFPDSPVIVPEAELEDLDLHWRMAGYRDTGAWREAYRAEMELFGAVREWLPLKFIPVSRAELLDDPEKCLRGLCQTLGLEYAPRMLAALEQLRAEEPYREDGHWRHYAELLGRA